MPKKKLPQTIGECNAELERTQKRLHLKKRAEEAENG